MFMPPAQPNTSDNRLTRVEVAVSRMEGQVSHLVSEFAALKEKVEMMLGRLNDHQDILYGDHGKSGLIAQSEHLEELEKALKGYGREPGLIADIKNLLVKMQEFDDNKKWLTRLIIGAILTDIIVHFLKVP
jgi:predicted RNase H-like nuclease (RuvC/YqgF family)